jgi:hypothetical protein
MRGTVRRSLAAIIAAGLLAGAAVAVSSSAETAFAGNSWEIHSTSTK